MNEAPGGVSRPTPKAEPVGRKRAVGIAALGAGIVLAAAALRICDLGAKDVWVDEANGVVMSQGSLGDLFTRLRLDSSPPLYYIILHAWMSVFGQSEIALRSLSVLAGLGMVACTFVVGRRLFSLETGALAGLLTAILPIHVFYSQTTRMYALLGLVALLSVYWLWRAITDGKRVFVVAYGLTTLVALYVHNFALYLLPAHGVILLWSGSLWKRPFTWLICAGGIVAGYLPWLPVFLAQLENYTHYNWLLPYWQQHGATDVLVHTLASFTPGPPYAHFTFAKPAQVQLPSLLLFSLTAVLGAVRALRGARGAVEAKARAPWLLSFVCVPLASALVGSALITPSYVFGRTDQLVFPGFVLLVAVGLTVIRPLPVRYGLLAVFVFYSALGLRHYYGNQWARSDREIAQAIAARARPGDAVLCTSLTRASLQYYLDRAEVPVTFFSYPRDSALHLGNQDDSALLKDPARLGREIYLVEQQIKEKCGPRSRFFLVLADMPVNKLLHDGLVRSGRTTTLEIIGDFKQAGTGVDLTLLLQRF